MKKQLVSICLVVLMLPAFSVIAFANEGYALSPRNFMPEKVIARLLEVRKGTNLADASIVDHDPTSGYVDYVSWISYDVLSEMSTGWNTAGVIVYNATMDAYFLRISYMPTVSSDGNMKYCALGTSNGFCYGSKTTISSEVTIDT